MTGRQSVRSRRAAVAVALGPFVGAYVGLWFVSAGAHPTDAGWMNSVLAHEPVSLTITLVAGFVIGCIATLVLWVVLVIALWDRNGR